MPTGRPIGNGVHFPVQYVDGSLSDGLDGNLNGMEAENLVANNSDDLFETTDADDDDYHDIENGGGGRSIRGHEAARLLREPLNR